MNKKEVYICVTLCHLYVTLLVIGKRKSKDSCVILLNANDAQIYRQFRKLEKSLQKNGYKVNCRLRNKIKDILGIEGINNRMQYKWVRNVLGTEIDNGFILFNFAWNMQYIYTTANLFFRKCEEAYFIEEGAMMTVTPPQAEIKVIIKKLTGAAVDFYREGKLKGIYVQNPEIYPDFLRYKLKKFNMRELLNKVDENTREIIVRIFMGDLNQKADITKIKGMGIIYTQPLSEEGYISEEQKISYYKGMAEYYSQYGDPVIKLHPRDLTDYKFDRSYIVLPAYFPSELLQLLNIHFRYAVGICTSAVLTTEADYKVNLNNNFLKDKVFELKALNLCDQ